MIQTDTYRIDSHKLLFHPHRVANWLNGENIVPLYIEISPTGVCNHRCLFCAKDYIGYPSRSLDTNVLLTRLNELAKIGIRSVMYGGEGEPLLHSDIAQIVEHTRTVGIDVAMSTNGVVLTGDLAVRILPMMSWLKVSINAGTPAGYAKIHCTSENDFRTVLANLKLASTIIRDSGLGCALGTQAVLLADNAEEMEELAFRVRDTGVSYLVIKPYSQHHSSNTRAYAQTDYSCYNDLADRLAQFSTDSFSVIFRHQAMNKLKCSSRIYDRCLALPFWAYIDSAGDVWGCSSFIGDDRFCYGNINHSSFGDIWESQKRKRSLEYTAKGLEAEECRVNCRMDEVNRYLWELIHPSPHVNFI